MVKPRVESGPIVPRKPPRPFPWRLWLYAITLTGAAGAGGYFAWQYRTEAISKSDALEKCTGDRDPALKHAAQCTTELDALTKKAKQLEVQNTEFSKNLHASKEELEQLRKQKAEADKRMAAIEDFQKKFAKLSELKDLRVSARRGELVLSLPSEVLFPVGSAELSKPGEYAVVQLAGVLKTFPDRRFLVVGHTDTQDFAKGKDQCAIKDNWQLSTERALVVTRVMVVAGMDAKNLLPAGAGEHDPISGNEREDGRKKNRRIEIALLPAINELPPLPASLHEDAPPAPAAPAPAPAPAKK